MTSARITRIIRWSIPLIFVVFGILMLILSHGHLTGVHDSAAETNPFVATHTDRDSVLSTIGIGSLVVGLMVWLIGWMVRLSMASGADREVEDADRDYFVKHGHWPSESERSRPTPRG